MFIFCFYFVYSFKNLLICVMRECLFVLENCYYMILFLETEEWSAFLTCLEVIFVKNQ